MSGNILSDMKILIDKLHAVFMLSLPVATSSGPLDFTKLDECISLMMLMAIV